MSMKLFLSAILFLNIISTQLATGVTGGGDKLSAYQVLQQYGFHVGILPEGVTGYELNRDMGEFKAYLNETCSFDLEGSYLLSYKPTITGVVSPGKIEKLTGVSVKMFLLWLNIEKVVRSGDELDFYVGILSASFPVDNFAVCRRCGCRLVCGSGQVSAMPMSS